MDASKTDAEMKKEVPEESIEQKKKLEALSKKTGLSIATLRLV